MFHHRQTFIKMKKKTLVVGATPNPTRYAFLAANRLIAHGHPIELVGIKKGEIAGKAIMTEKKQLEDIDTVTLYVGPQNQPEWYDYIISLKPKRIIFNPGTENAEFENLANKHGIETEQACTLVMLAAEQY
jgi:predicted CoA-binding protein